MGVCTVLRTVQAKDPWNNNGNQVSLRSAVAAQGKARVWHGAPHRAGKGPFCEQGESHGGIKMPLREHWYSKGCARAPTTLAQPCDLPC